MIYVSDDPVAARLTGAGGAYELTSEGPERKVVKGFPRTLTELYRHAARHGRSVMTICGGAPVTFDTMFGRAASLSQTLGRRYGVTRGSFVAVAMANGPEWMMSFIAITALGGIVVGVNSRGAPEELLSAIERTGCSLAILDVERATLLAQATSVPSFARIVVGEGDALIRQGRDMGFAEASDGVSELSLATVEPDDSALVLFTSGTTGYPKGALQSHGALAHAVALAGLAGTMTDLRYESEFGRSIERQRRSNHSPTIVAGPLFHLGGIIPFLRCMYFGARTLFSGKWNPENVFRIIEGEGVARLGFVPTMIWDLLRSPAAGPANIGQVLFISSGAAAISPALTREIAERMPQCMLGNTYGSTETAGYVSMICGREFLANPMSCGRIVPSVAVRLLDENGRDVPPSEPGEIAVRSPCVMKGYVGDPEATAASFHEGWFRTGDIGRMNADNLLHIVDRKKNMVISGGENIYCAEVERVLSEQDGVLEVLAYGVPDDRLGEKLAVTILPAPGARLTDEAVKSYVAARLAIYKVPRIVEFRDTPFARTPSGKLDRASFLRSRSLG
ncbi:MAG TPA: class I adenylate-forming enzyme family protein [Alphaproteobacteria bacterium]|nr:class I adenylate-forming enzyme family protein [Alphaproteobacteria bacterium]